MQKPLQSFIGVFERTSPRSDGLATNRELIVYIEDLMRGGTKVTPQNVVNIRRLPDGRTVWLETGNDTAGLQHIYKRHEIDFVNKGVPRDQISSVGMGALESGAVVGTNGTANFYRIVHNGVEQHIAIGVGSNGFVVRANPVSNWKPLQ